ncbi:uncharacterized protein LOC122928427 isoform X1 [Bufo gargarizans]|uniref:uncharacterized protein LOC122928427 isoform X1 n=2 Tax=Bufo gargarizans TaxID=30331 RepID=UPI001CF10C3C|nr:uncharacterized protein LOC122928427 isoform X1 [Bufo gargarizans]
MIKFSATESIDRMKNIFKSHLHQNSTSMETVMNWMHGKKAGDRNHSAWRKVCNTWFKIFELGILTRKSSFESKEWNPWRDWCQSWEEFQSSEEKPPKSEKQKAAIFSEMFHIAKLTRDKLEDAKAMRTCLEQVKDENQNLRTQNLILKDKCEVLQCKLDAEKQIREENDRFNNYNVEKEVKLRKELEVEKQNLKFQVQGKEEEFWQMQAKLSELEKALYRLQGQLVERKEKDFCQFTYNHFVIPGCKCNQPTRYAQIKNGEGEKRLDLDYIRDIANRLGKVTIFNVFDWLCSFEEEYKIWLWSGKDVEQILLRCMNTSTFSSLPLSVRTCQTTLLDICKHIAERLIPDLDGILDTEKMSEGDDVLQYFHRMWMIYRITENPDFQNKDDLKYTKAIFQGLLPHLYEELGTFCFDDYEDLECAVLSAEYSWSESEKYSQNWYKKTYRAGPGCPSRYRIWNRLQKYNVPYENIHNAPYWELLVYLSRFEDLETGKPR